MTEWTDEPRMRSLRGIPLLETLFGDRGGDEEPHYVCGDCGKPLAVQYHSCPECGSFNVDRNGWDLE